MSSMQIVIIVYCDERPERTSALPWRRMRNTCTRSSRADRPQLRLICPRLDKPCEAGQRGERDLPYAEN